MNNNQQIHDLKKAVISFSMSLSYLNKIKKNKKQGNTNDYQLKPYEEAIYSLEKIHGYQMRIIKYMITKIKDEAFFTKDIEYAKKGGYKLIDMDETEKTYDLMKQASLIADKMNRWDKIKLLIWYKIYISDVRKKENKFQKRK